MRQPLRDPAQDPTQGMLELQPAQVRWAEHAIVAGGAAMLLIVVLTQPAQRLLSVLLPGAALVAAIAMSIAAARRWASETVRRVLLASYIYGFCAMALVVVGPRVGVGAGLMAAVVLGTALLGKQGIAMAAAVTFLMLSGVGVTFIQGMVTPLRPPQLELGDWLRMSLACGTISLIVGYGIANISARLDDILRRTAEALRDQRQEKAERLAVQHTLDVAARSEALGRLAGGIAHDVNNSLAVILTNARMLEDLAEASSDERRLATAMIVATQRAAQTARDVLAFGRGDPDEQSYVSAAEALPNIVGFLQRILPRDVEARIRCDSDRHIPIRSAALHQAVLSASLVLVDDTGDGGVLEIRVSDADEPPHVGGVHLDVQRLGSSASRAAALSPTSPQLAVLEHFVVRRGGSLAVEVSDDGAHRMRMSFPAAEAPQRLPSMSQDSAATDEGLPARVLLVDDERPVRRAIARVVRTAGYEVVEAFDGQSARDAFERERFDLLLTDAIMPNTDTGAMIRAFAEHFPTAPVIVCSGYVREDILQRGIETGDYDFIAKPFAPEELTRLLAETLLAARESNQQGDTRQ